ncbi:MAG: hypothetical protein K8T10_13155 [Candidatus Eremiobacteraeota bacterium]|nr:hypothetical protein [Candidatus Eremiobacteraeota bacterium]
MPSIRNKLARYPLQYLHASPLCVKCAWTHKSRRAILSGILPESLVIHHSCNKET